MTIHILTYHPRTFHIQTHRKYTSPNLATAAFHRILLAGQPIYITIRVIKEKP